MELGETLLSEIIMGNFSVFPFIYGNKEKRTTRRYAIGEWEGRKGEAERG